jgi:hypothetical protein
MATTPEDEEVQPIGWASDITGKVQPLVEEASTIVHGRTGRPLWPVLLISAGIVSILLDGPVATVLGVLALLFLAVWMSTQR